MLTNQRLLPPAPVHYPTPLNKQLAAADATLQLPMGDTSRLLEPGEKEVRNPAIAMALQRIDICKQTGTGLRMMRREWQTLGHAAPSHANNRVNKSFTLFLPDVESRASEAATDQATPQVEQLLLALHEASTRDFLMEQLKLKDREHFRRSYLAACRTWNVESENRPQRAQFLPDLQPNSPAIRQKYGKKCAAAVDLQPTTSKSDRLLVPALETGLIEMTLPDKPTSRLQKYRLAEADRQ